MHNLSHNIKVICVLLIFVLTVILKIPTANATPKIFITEIFPNPKGKDGGKEWIELFNAGNESINLDDWQIAQTSTNFYIKNLKIDAKSYTLIDKKNIKKPLKNKDNTITLINPSGESVAKIHYDSSEEEKSFSLTKIIDPTTSKSTWTWTPPSKGEKNKDFHYMEGKILRVDNKTFTIITTPKAGTAYSVSGEENIIHYKNINTLLLKIFSKQKTTLTILASEGVSEMDLVKIISAR
jgi:hypothetical protein